MSAELSVDRAFGGKRVLLTGTTGFIGKVVLEKLIREIPGIASLVLLLRGDAQERFRKEVLGSSVFEHLRRTDPLRLQAAVQRMRFVSGEIAQPRLGLSVQALEALATEVDVVIHVAASVDFREPLDEALAVNALSLREIGTLVRAAGGVPLVQVSTCYVHGLHRGTVMEEIAAPARATLAQRADGSFDVEALVTSLQQEVAAVKAAVPVASPQRRALVDLGIARARELGWNDTYTLTKWIGEQIAWRETQGATLAIVRPAIVESACREPQGGWIEGMKVGDAIVLAYARGKTSLFPARPGGVADIIPVDLVANSIVLAAAEALQQPGARRIYQAGSSTRNPITVGEYVKLCQIEMRENASAYPRLVRKPEALARRPFRTVPRGVFVAWLAAAHALACAANRMARAMGAREDMALFERLRTTRELAVVFSFYTSPNYVFDSRRLTALAERFDAADRWRFEVDPRCFDWSHYVRRVHLPGLERFALRDEPPAGERAVLTEARA